MKRFRFYSLPVLWAIISLACSLLVPQQSPGVTPAPTLPPPPPITTPVPALHGKIAYASERGGLWQVIAMNADGSDETSLTASFGAYSRPSWSPDGGRLGMRMDISASNGIAVMDVRHENGKLVGTQPVPLNSDFSDGPSWSPDGKKLIYSSTQNNSGWLTFISDISTGSSQQFTAIPENATDTAWSPDGTRIVYDAYTDPSKQIRDLYLVNVDGSNPVQLTNTPDISEFLPAWSPDGTQIAFSAAQYAPEMVGLEGDIYVINADGSNQRRITTDPRNDFDPAWSPDGTQIAFVSDRNANNDSNYEIYLINADGTGELRLTNNHYTDRWPTWRADQPEDGAPAACQSALTLLADVTIPPGTRFVQPQDFTKIWRVQNSGTCTWTPTAYSLRSVGVDNLAGPVQMTLPGAIQPGAIVDLAVTLTAPDNARRIRRRLAGDRPRRPASLWRRMALLPACLCPLRSCSPARRFCPGSLYFLAGPHRNPSALAAGNGRSSHGPRSRMSRKASTTFQVSRDGHIAYISGSQWFSRTADGANRQVLVDGFGGRMPWPGPRIAAASPTSSDRHTRPQYSIRRGYPADRRLSTPECPD